MISTSSTHTQKIAQELAKSLQDPCIILLHGDLGMGKSTFVQGFVSALKGGLGIRTKSPTYAFAHSYSTTPVVHHLDLYRLASAHDLDDLGLWELIEDTKAFVLIEWPPSNLNFSESQKIVRIHFSQGKKAHERILKISY